ncbi:MAG: ZIP family metal transporter [Bacilli bacterium]
MINNNALLLSGIAGFSTLIGFLITLIIKNRNNNKIIAFILSISSAIILYLSVFELAKESYIIMRNDYTLIYSTIYVLKLIIIGVIIGFLLEVLINKLSKNKYSKLIKLSIFATIALFLHNIPEGIITYISTLTNLKLGLLITFAIMIHNIPEGIIISLPILVENNNIKKAFKYTFLAGFAEIIGTLIALMFFKDKFNELLLSNLISIISGIMIFISIYEIFPNALNYNKRITIYTFVITLTMLILLL